MAPNAPPAPVMARMPAELVTPSVIQDKVFFFSAAGTRVMARNTPKIRAITGLPIKENNIFTTPSPKGALGKSPTDLSAISTMGSRMGEKLWSAPGSLPYF